MAVTRADKAAELQALEAAFKGSDSAVLVDYKGMNVPQVTELRRQLRTAKAKYKVVKNTIAKRALKGTSFESLDKYFEGTTAVAYTETDPVALAKTLTTFAKTAPTLKIKAAVVQRRSRRRLPSWQRCRASRNCSRSCCSCCRRRWCRSSAS
jgi:large subunit ribosomal protein L10